MPASPNLRFGSPLPPALKLVINIAPTEKDKYVRAFELMRTKMVVYHSKHNIPWDQPWIEANYRAKDNYSVKFHGTWIGFLSLEWKESELYIHTFQLAESIQGSIYGYRIFKWILAEAAGRGVSEFSRKSFKDNLAVDIYKKIGFEVVGSSGPFLDLHMSINKASKKGALAARLFQQRYVKHEM